ncbi:MAG: hypothetical protein BKP49_02545 [Treponema sp. CETP13]|nr:MAG: hypothetical protein BKP49_02545 [Treponema sp. CETP13]
MKTVLRQEWRASKKRIGMTSIVIAGIMLFTILVNLFSYYAQDIHVFGFGKLLYIMCLIIAPWGISLFTLIKGSGNLHSILFKDTNYLVLTLPVHSWVLMGGKMLMNLFEYFIYAVPAAIYLSFLGPTGEFLFFRNTINGFNFSFNSGAEVTNTGTSYWYNVKMIYKTVLENWQNILQIGLILIILFIVVQIFFNMAFAVYGTFIKTRKRHIFLMALIVFLIFFIPIRCSSAMVMYLSLNNILPETSAFVGVMLAFAFLYFVLTSWLIEKKIEV